MVIFPILRCQYWTFLYYSQFSYRSSNYCDSSRCRSVTLLKALKKVTVIFSLSPLRSRKSNNYRYRNSWKSEERERAIKIEAKNWYQKGLRVITLQEAIKKSQILLSQYWKNEWLDGTIVISYFGGSNNIFADCS